MGKLIITRRDLIKKSALAAGALAFTSAGVPLGRAAASDAIRVGIVGCGGRGVQAGKDCVKASQGVTVVALADAFPDRLDGAKKEFKVADDHCFLGLDGYKKLMALADVNLVILATPPGFRPMHLTEAVNAGKNIFMEKPVAVCPAGIQMVMEASKKAEEKKLAIVAGTQRRHDPKYIETMKRVLDGMIGTVMSAQCYWNQGGLDNVYKRKPNEGDVEYQLRNWYYFTWLSGDHIVEQHVHNIDIINWAMKAMPDAVVGCGGRQARTGPEYGNIYDHFGVEFYYPNDIRTISMCRQIEGTDPRVCERIAGTKGVVDLPDAVIKDYTGKVLWKYEGPTPNAQEVEHADLVKSIRDGAPLNEGQRIAESTLTAIMGRESAYTRQKFNRSWFEKKCTLNLLPPDGLKLADAKPVESYAIPGKYKLAGFEQPAPKKKG